MREVEPKTLNLSGVSKLKNWRIKLTSTCSAARPPAPFPSVAKRVAAGLHIPIGLVGGLSVSITVIHSEWYLVRNKCLMLLLN